METRPATLPRRMPQRTILRKLPKDKKKGRSKIPTGPVASVGAYLPVFFFMGAFFIMGAFSMKTSVLASEKVAPAGTR